MAIANSPPPPLFPRLLSSIPSLETTLPSRPPVNCQRTILTAALISLIYCHPSAGAIPTSPARPSAPPLRPNGARTQKRRSRPRADRPSDRTPPQENQIRCDEFGIRLRCLERALLGRGAVGGALFPRRARSGGISRDLLLPRFPLH